MGFVIRNSFLREGGGGGYFECAFSIISLGNTAGSTFKNLDCGNVSIKRNISYNYKIRAYFLDFFLMYFSFANSVLP